MNDNQPQAAQPATPQQTLANIEAVRDLFARAHDYLAQANHPGHLGMKVAEVLNFLAFQHADFKARAKAVEDQIANETKAKASAVDVAAAKAAVDAVLVPAKDSLSDEHGSAEAPKA